MHVSHYDYVRCMCMCTCMCGGCAVYAEVREGEGGREEREREREREGGRERKREGERKVPIVPHTFSPWRITFCFDILHCTIVCILIGWLSEMEEKNTIK